MFWAAEGDTATTTTDPLENAGKLELFGLNMDVFDFFVLIFTVIIAWGVLRSLKAREKNKFAIGFGVVALLVFLLMDVVMIQHWVS